MIINQTYRLHGYIEYVSSPVGFVTPVFFGESDDYFIQVTSSANHNNNWEKLPYEYHSLVIPTKASEENHTASIVYGFKWDNILFFGTGKNMAEYLSQSFLPNTKLGRELAIGFLEDWISIEPVQESLSKEAIWKKCLGFVGNESKTMPGIFFETFEVVDYNQGLLTIKSKNSNIKRVFESQFKEEIISYIRSEIDNFEIELLDNPVVILPALPFIHYGGGEGTHLQGSVIMQTKINPYKGFYNYIVSDFNVEAYQSALNYIQKSTSPVLIVRGAAGTGKSHLVHSLAKQINNTRDDRKVGIYNVFFNSSNVINEQELQHFETTALENDVIIIDDAHNLNTTNGSFQKLVTLLKKWSELQKTVVLTYRDSYQINPILNLVDHCEQVMIKQPADLDKLKFIDAKINDYNIRLTGRDILSLSANIDLRSISDIQRHLTRLYLIENIKDRTRNHFISYNKKDFHSLKWVESCVFEYFNIDNNANRYHYGNQDVVTLNAKIISHFIQEILLVPPHGIDASSEIASVDGYFYSIDNLQYLLFESKQFKEIILDIMNDLVYRGKK